MKALIFVKSMAYLSVTFFFVTLTYQVIFFSNMANEKLPEYEILWEGAFAQGDRFVEGADKVTTALNLTLPLIVTEIARMNNSMDNIEKSMLNVNYSVTNMSLAIPNQMGQMNSNMGRIQKSFTPQGFIKNMMPFW